MNCIYCGVYNNISKDHVPSKCLLRKPFSQNLRTVPSCISCNNSFSKDEEYFRLVIIGLLCHSEEANEVFDGSISRSMDRDQKMESLLFGSLQVIDGKVALDIDESRIFRIAEKIVRGLEYLETGALLAKDQEFFFEFFEINQSVNVELKSGTDFAYKKVQENPKKWEFTFYSAVRFNAIII